MTSPLDAALRARTQRPHRDLMQPPKLFNVSPDADERTVRGTFLEKSSALGSARAPLAAAREFRVRLNELLATTKDRRELAQRASPYLEQITKKFDAAVPTLQKLREVQEREIAKVITASTEDASAQEIRAYFRGVKEPFSEATKLLEQGDLKTVRALLSQPSFLCGMTPQAQDALRLQARAKFCPGQHGLSTDLDHAIQQVQRVGSEFVKEVGTALHEWSGGDAQAAVDRAFGG